MDPLTASKGLKRDTKGDKGRKPNSFIASFLRWMESQSINGRQLSRTGESITENISYKWKYNWIPEHKLDFLSFIWRCQQWREFRYYARLFGGYSKQAGLSQIIKLQCIVVVFFYQSGF